MNNPEIEFAERFGSRYSEIEPHYCEHCEKPVDENNCIGTYDYYFCDVGCFAKYYGAKEIINGKEVDIEV